MGGYISKEEFIKDFGTLSIKKNEFPSFKNVLLCGILICLTYLSVLSRDQIISR